ncbi:pyruvate kinase [Candidatus Beckwithbacteria bacterium]|nr:pyruvate kinase [Candidatus Beckwithbacteria bacterium]
MIAQKQTKIVATIGPASDSPETIKELIETGVNVFRFNMKHADIAWHEERIKLVDDISKEMNVPLGILIDLQGPEIRIETRDHADIIVKKGERIIFASTFSNSDINVCIPHEVVFEVLKEGDQILIDDGFLEFTIVEKNGDQLVVEAHDNYIIKHRKGVNLPGKHINLPSLIEDDLRKLDMAGKSKVDFVALSFSRTKEDIEILRTEMGKRNVKAAIIAKIESQPAIDNLDDLIEAADGIMVARGDLGIEIPIKELAFWQKEIIRKCRIANKPVITATQMLQSMVDSPRPTRAEATDVANAIFDGTDAVMLSGESASGKYPVKAVDYMSRIAAFTESKTNLIMKCDVPHDTAQLIVHAAMAMIDSVEHPKIDAIIAFTETGYSAKILSSFRPNLPIIAVSRNQTTVEQLTLSFGVSPVKVDFPKGDILHVEPILEQLKAMRIVEKGQIIISIHGSKWQIPGLTNSVSIIRVS